MVLNNFVLRYALFNDNLYILLTIVFSFVAFSFNLLSFCVLIMYVKKRQTFFDIFNVIIITYESPGFNINNKLI